MNRPWLNQSMKTRGSLAVALLTILTGVGVANAAEEAICSDPAVFFCDNFEDRALGGNDLQTNKGGKTTGWDISDTTTMVISTDTANDGTKSLKFIYPACSWVDGQGQGCGAGLMSNLVKFNRSDWYHRHYIKWSSDYTWAMGAADKHVAFETIPTGPGGTLVYRQPWLYSRGFATPTKAIFEDEKNGNVTYIENQGNDLSFNLNQWYCVEVHLQFIAPGSSIAEMWIDDVLRTRWTNVGFTDPWSDAFLSGYWNTSTTPGSKGPGAKYFDNIVMSTARIGCLGARSSGPAVPSGLTVR